MTTLVPQPLPALDRPLKVSLVDGEVVVVGPGAIAFSMTPAAALATARLITEALEGTNDNSREP